MIFTCNTALNLICILKRWDQSNRLHFPAMNAEVKSPSPLRSYPIMALNHVLKLSFDCIVGLYTENYSSVYIYLAVIFLQIYWSAWREGQILTLYFITLFSKPVYKKITVGISTLFLMWETWAIGLYSFMFRLIIALSKRNLFQSVW